MAGTEKGASIFLLTETTDFLIIGLIAGSIKYLSTSRSVSRLSLFVLSRIWSVGVCLSGVLDNFGWTVRLQRRARADWVHKISVHIILRHEVVSTLTHR